jgi:hypothetical protein
LPQHRAGKWGSSCAKSSLNHTSAPKAQLSYRAASKMSRMT